MLYQRIQMYLGAKTLAGRQLYVGQRVAARAKNIVEKNWYYGIVKSLEAKVAVVVIDRGNREIRINQKKLVPVEKWEDSPNGERFDDLVLTDLEPKDLFLQKKSIASIGYQAIRGMYWYVNAQVYNGVLPLDVPIKRQGSSTRFGEISARWNFEKKQYDINHLAVSKQHHVIAFIFNTIAHEAIHVFQYFDRTEYYPRGWNAHGDSFTYWIPIMKQRLGVNITITAEKDNEVEVAPTAAKKNGKVNYCAMWPGRGDDKRWYGLRTQDPNKLNYNIRNRVLTASGISVYKVYDERIALHFARTRGDIIKKGKSIPDTTVRFVQQNCELFWKPGDPTPLYDKLFWLIYSPNNIPEGAPVKTFIVYSTNKQEVFDFIKKRELEAYLVYDMPPSKENIDILTPLSREPHYYMGSIHREFIIKYGSGIHKGDMRFI